MGGAQQKYSLRRGVRSNYTKKAIQKKALAQRVQVKIRQNPIVHEERSCNQYLDAEEDDAKRRVKTRTTVVLRVHFVCLRSEKSVLSYRPVLERCLNAFYSQ